MSALPQQFLDTALLAIERARTVTQSYFRTTLDVESKQDRSPVTVADRKTEQVITEIIADQHPGHGIFAEESGDNTAAEEWRWIIDPIDGTKSFATGKPTFGTLIALLHHEQPVLGIIDHPALDEQWIGIKGKPTTYNGKPCHSSDTQSLSGASIYTTTLDMFDQESFPLYDQLSQSCQFRAFGGDCYSYGLLSAGFTDLVCEADLKPYDYFALVPVVEGAGGIITDWQGQSLSLLSGDRVLAAANSTLHKQAVAILQKNNQ